MAFCEYCGQPLPEGSKFCCNCGRPVNSNSHASANKTERGQTYAGKIMKCPNCGEVLNAFVTICPSCGYEIRNAEATAAVTDFGLRLAEAKSDQEKINIIRNFPIPNTKEDILEFVFLASTNINENQNLDDEVSDAWYAKLQQSYQKAELTFKDQPEFVRVESSYRQIRKARGRLRFFKEIRKLLGYRLVRIIIIILLLLLIVRIGNFSSSYRSTQDETFVWPTSGCSQLLPVPASTYGTIWENNETEFRINVKQTSEEEIDEYIEDCIGLGFTLYADEDSSSYTAYNEDRYYLEIYYYSSGTRMDITVEAPMEMTEIRWPDSDLVGQIPEPSSLTGNIQSETSTDFAVYIDDVSSEAFNEYINACMDRGFTKDYSREQDQFYGDNKDGYHLTVKSEVFDMMYIKIQAPDKDEEEDK